MKNKLIELLQKWFGQVVKIEAGDKVTLIFTYPENADPNCLMDAWTVLQEHLPECVVVLIPEGVTFHKAILEKK